MNSTFDSNVGLSGGAIDMAVDMLAVSVTSSNFTQNAAQQSYAGCLDLSRSPKSLQDSAEHRSLQAGSAITAGT